MTPIRMIVVLLGLVVSWPGVATGQSSQDIVIYYHTDATGSVRAITDANGGLLARYDFEPFGVACNSSCGTGTPPETIQFSGKERDTDTQLDYFGARLYESVSGRFTTVDPLMDIETALFDPQRWNRYSYVGNRPTRLVDPDGRGWVSALFKVGKAVVKGGNVAAEFAGIVDDVKTIADSDASLGSRAWSLFSLGTEVFSPVSVGDAKAAASFAMRHTGDVAGASGFTRSTFRDNLGRLTGGIEDGAHAHHMLPLKFGANFERAGLNINDPRYGGWWAAQDHLRNARGYNDRWQEFFSRNPKASRDEILEFGRQLGSDYGLNIHY